LVFELRNLCLVDVGGVVKRAAWRLASRGSMNCSERSGNMPAVCERAGRSHGRRGGMRKQAADAVHGLRNAGECMREHAKAGRWQSNSPLWGGWERIRGGAVRDGPW
jgi:hypothetical protein